eukprot:TRINITY_DN3015_c2_g1_i2.p1 TRINITY_DN3015_c2_g1~~TRINITY_DN3015_c2_g1_i2.p1  ORF type:complete len:809 (+),score=151.82 TRINITY_DN3015_c2_g1_i2:301-2427(+)
MNAGLFQEGTLQTTDIEDFMQGFLVQLNSFDSWVTTVSFTSAEGHLFGVYKDYGTFRRWESETDSETNKIVLSTYEIDQTTGEILKFLFVENDYNSSEREWYTVVDPPAVNASWTSIYLMGNGSTNGNMLSQSNICLDKDGRIQGVTTVDMALGFAGEILHAIDLPDGYYSFVVDVNHLDDDQVRDPVLIGVSDESELLRHDDHAHKLSFVSVSDSGILNVQQTNNWVIDNFHGWDNLDGCGDSTECLDSSSQVTGAISIDGVSHFLLIVNLRRVNLHWAVVVLLPEDIFLGSFNATTNWLLIMYVSVLVCKALVSAVVIYFFIAPLHKLAKELELLSTLETESSISLSLWTEIRHLQLTFVHLLGQMKIVKTYMPQALFHLPDNDNTDTKEREMDEVSDSNAASGSSVQQHPHSTQLSNSTATLVVPFHDEEPRHTPPKNGPGGKNIFTRRFEYRKKLVVMCISIRYSFGKREIDVLHKAHCRMLEDICQTAKSYAGCLDHISSDDVTIMWGRDSIPSFTKVTETGRVLSQKQFSGTLTIGTAVSSGVTGTIGGDSIRAIATLTNARYHASVLARLATVHNLSLLFSRRIREQANIGWNWEAVDVLALDGHIDIVYWLEGKKSFPAQDWLYQMEEDSIKDTISGHMEALCFSIRNQDQPAAMMLIEKLRRLQLPPNRQAIFSHLHKLVAANCSPIVFGFSFSGTTIT